MAVYKRGSRWFYDFMIRRTRYRAAIPEARTKAQAERAETLAREDVYHGRYGGKRAPKLADFIESVYMPWARTNKTSVNSDKARAGALNDALGTLALDAISPIHIEKYKRERLTGVTRLKRQRSPQTVNLEIALLSRILNLAIEQGQLTNNPCRKVRKLRVVNQRQRFLTEEEEDRLMAALAKPGRESWQRAAVFALNTGMRRGEIFGLEWSQIDWSRQVITLTRTKTGRTRVVPMNHTVSDLLTKMQTQQQGECVFPGFTRRHLLPRWGIWREACNEAGLSDLRFHDLRHVAATRLAEAGADAFTIAAVLGHNNIQMTARYAHSTDEGTRRAMDSLQRAEKDCRKIVTMERRHSAG